MKKQFLFCLFFLLAASLQAQYSIDLRDVRSPALNYIPLGDAGPAGREIRVNNLYLEESGVPLVPVMGECHFSRMDCHYWRDALLKMKASGVNIVATYCLWSLHEEQEGELSWKGDLNLRGFLELCRELGLKVHLRIGPYCNAEIRNGALPDWMVGNKRFSCRSNDPLYLEYVRCWYRAIFSQVKGLLYKEGGPVIAVQLENEYVREGMVIPHLLRLKKMAVECGFDVPLYTMTHWMDSEYPKGEIVPYAGFYIEAPWTTSGKEEMATSNFEFFTYNRLSDNIGTDIIKIEGEVESLSGENNDSPFFTCEVGVGTASFYHRRAVVPEEMAGENINLRLGCGANLMGYYMYAGGTNPVGKINTFQSSGPRISYDYQAPVRETGTLGTVMGETKKYNYFMNDFGSSLAPAVAYLPVSNQKRENLQWAVRLSGSSGYLFCSNYLYKHNKKDYRQVQFAVKLKDETICFPRKKVTVKDGTYFFWPFNQQLSGILLKYSTTQPVCSLKEGVDNTYFFFEDDFIPGEYRIGGEGIKGIEVSGGKVRQENGGYFADGLIAGMTCVIKITKEDGSVVRLVTLTEEESDLIWKGKFRGAEFVALSRSSLIYDRDGITLIDDTPSAEIFSYADGKFDRRIFQATPRFLQAEYRKVGPLGKSIWIRPAAGKLLQRTFTLNSFSTVARAYLRYKADGLTHCRFNGSDLQAVAMGEYCRADVTSLVRQRSNVIEFTVGNGMIAEVEILMQNGERLTWNTDGTWHSEDNRPAVSLAGKAVPVEFAPAEHLALYEVNVPVAASGEEETRMYISYKGNLAAAYQNGRLTADSFYDGTEWIVSVSRLKEDAAVNPVVIRIEGLKSADEPIYFEKNVIPADCVNPVLSDIRVVQEYRFDL